MVFLNSIDPQMSQPSEIFNHFQCGEFSGENDENSSSVNPSSSLVNGEKISTFLRIRPLDNTPLELTPYTIIDSNHLRFKTNKCVKAVEKARFETEKVAKFNYIFDGSSTQQNVFTKCCEPLVEDVLSGTSGLLFCFGTTSSGKSYTMRGPPDDPGLIPLSLEKIFNSRHFLDEPLIGKSKYSDICLLDHEQQIKERQFKDLLLPNSSSQSVSNVSVDSCQNYNEDGYQYVCYLSYFEIYNDYVYDLLLPDSAGRGPPLSLFPDEEQRYYVKDLKSVMVSSYNEALQIYSFGWQNLKRNIKETGLNKTSSRSHSFLCISLIRFKEDNGLLLESQVSHLTLGDLAGSERQNKTHSRGSRVKEGGNINVSLMHLKECFKRTKDKQKNSNNKYFINFRNCALTKFFQPYLNGTGRVWMIININPLPTLLNETCGSLDLGETASHITTNSIRIKLEESKNRMTQVWLKSSQRWSSFARDYGGNNVSQILETDEESAQENVDTIQHDGDLISTIDRDEKIRTEVIQQFEQILSEVMEDHAKELQLTRDNYEMTMEARLNLMSKNYQGVIKNLEARIEQLTNTSPVMETETEPSIAVEKFSAEIQTDPNVTVEKLSTEIQTDPNVTVEKLSAEIQTEPTFTEEKLSPTVTVEKTSIETQTEQIIAVEKCSVETQSEPIVTVEKSSVEIQTEPSIAIINLSVEIQTEPTVPVKKISVETQSEPTVIIEKLSVEIQTEPIIAEEKFSIEIQTDQIIAVEKFSVQTQTEPTVPDKKLSLETQSKPTEKRSLEPQPKRSSMAQDSTKSEKKARKAREITIDANYLPASVSELTKRKCKVDSPTTEITNEYLKMMFASASTSKTAKKSVKRSAKKPPPAARVVVADEEEVEEDELASLLLSQKKGKKKRDETPSIPIKRRKVHVNNNEFLETTLSPHIEDEIQEPNIKGGRVLRPRRKIKF